MATGIVSMAVEAVLIDNRNGEGTCFGCRRTVFHTYDLRVRVEGQSVPDLAHRFCYCCAQVTGFKIVQPDNTCHKLREFTA